MTLTIDTDEAAKLGITPVEYVYLQCKKYNLANDLDIDTLLELGLMNTDGDLTSHCEQIMFPTITDANLIFVKIYDLYPHKIANRVLKAKSIDSGDGKHCLLKYRIYQRQDVNIGTKMLKGLQNEILLRKKGNNEAYFQDIRTWFNQQTWDKYSDLDIQDTQERVERV
jgi:hypothetical protein